MRAYKPLTYVQESTRRALIAEACMSRLSDPKLQHNVIDALSDFEYKLLQKRLQRLGMALAEACAET